MYESIVRWQASGLSQVAWSMQEGISREKFKNWLKRYRQEHQGPHSFEAGQSTIPSGFIPLELELHKPQDHFSLTYSNGVRLQCPLTIGKKQLRGLVHLLD